MPNPTPKAASLVDGSGFSELPSISVTDPVCGARVDVSASTPHEDRGGWLYFFCSAHCREVFRAAPGQYTWSQTRA